MIDNSPWLELWNTSEPPGPMHIFVVDDEEAIASTLAAILKHAGYRATYFTNPILALSSARREAPNLLISDVSMPQLSGVELAIQFKTAAPLCTVMLFSGEGESPHHLRCAHELGYDFTILAKPIHPQELLQKVREMERFSGVKPDNRVEPLIRAARHSIPEGVMRLSARN